MAHESQRQFCLSVKVRFPERFADASAAILDCGSLDINGNNRYLFASENYFGIDVGEGRNVDRVCPIHEFDAPDASFDVVISTECFEHDEHYPESLKNIVRMLKPGGLLLFSCATTGRPEHGTWRTDPESSPFTNHYYKNLTADDVREVLDLGVCENHEFSSNADPADLYFWGVKRA